MLTGSGEMSSKVGCEALAVATGTEYLGQKVNAGGDPLTLLNAILEGKQDLAIATQVPDVGNPSSSKGQGLRYT